MESALAAVPGGQRRGLQLGVRAAFGFRIRVSTTNLVSPARCASVMVGQGGAPNATTLCAAACRDTGRLVRGIRRAREMPSGE
jgi:hypothetical protein